MSRIVRTLIPLALATAAAVSAMPMATAAPAAPAAAASTSELQVVGVGTFAGMAHTIRDSRGNWAGFGWLGGYDDFYGTYAVTSAIVNGEENVVFDYLAGPTHTPAAGFLIRHADGTWLNATPPPGGQVVGDDLGAANVNGTLTLVRLENGKFQVTTWDGSNWASWQDTGLSGDYRKFAVTAKGGTLRLVAIKGDGTGFIETDRTASGWTAPVTVNYTSSTGLGRGLQRISAAQVGDQLHVVATDNDRIYHTIGSANGSWAPPTDIAVATNYIEYPTDVAVAEVNGELQLVVTAYRAPAMSHTIRHADGTWQKFGNVGAVAGETNSGLITVASE
jgi:hypothetical protein